MILLLPTNLGLTTVQAAAGIARSLAAGEAQWIGAVIILLIWAFRGLASLKNTDDAQKRAEARKQLEDKIAADMAARRAAAQKAGPTQQVPMQFRFPQSLANPGGTTMVPPAASRQAPGTPIFFGGSPVPQALRPVLRSKSSPKPRPIARPIARPTRPPPSLAPLAVSARKPVRQQPDAPVVELIAKPLPSDKGMLPASEARIAAMIAAGQLQPSAARPVSAGAESLHRWFRPGTLRSQFILTEILQPPLSLREPR
jgi:hypothetical protein